MPSEFEFRLPLEHGLHARPASVLQEAAAPYASDIHIVNRRTGRQANAKSVLSLVGLDARHEDPCTLVVAGADEDRAFPAMKAFLTDVFPECDEEIPAPPSGAESAGAIVPRVLLHENATILRGTPVSPGVAEAPALVLGGLSLPASASEAGTAGEEKARFDSALAGLAADLENRLHRATNATEQDILKAHLGIARDPEFAGMVEENLRGVAVSAGVSAGAAVLAAEQFYAGMLGASESAVLRERALDVRDIAGQLITRMYGAGGLENPTLKAPVVCVADNLTPSQFLALDRRFLKGLALAEGGTTSHTVILARAFGVPCVVGVGDAHRRLVSGQAVILDARRGFVVPDPAEKVSRYYALEARREERRRVQFAPFIAAEGRTADGRRFHVAANVATPEEAEAAFANGAEGIGLFRTEMLFMDRETPPGEEEQFAAYARVVRAAGERPVIIRTLDVGGDKPVPYLALPAEENPFLGYRAIRFYPEQEALVRTQLRAILRAAALGTVWVMFPMVATVEEVRAAKAMVESARAGLEEQGTPCGDVSVGIMVETPAAALAVPQLSEEVAFFSLGTNDLTQYTLAVDRGNRKVAPLYSSLHPAVLRLLKLVVDEAHASGRWVGLCGEMGGQEALAPLLVGLGLDEISLAGPSVPALKAAVSRCETAACRELLARAVAAPDRAAVEAQLSAFSASATDESILGRDITDLESNARSREEVIKEMVDNLYLAGRVANPDTVEEAVWLREDVYSTGVGYGFAIPHCKSPDVAANSVGILRLKNPVEWKTLDGEPVRIALMLAIRESDHAEEHLKIFARLARKIMHEDFRERLLTEEDTDSLLRYIDENLQG